MRLKWDDLASLPWVSWRVTGKHLPAEEGDSARTLCCSTFEVKTTQPYRRPYSFVTVVHADDVWLLRLQARSMRLYLPSTLVGDIVVIENLGPGQHVAWRDQLWEEYGHLADRVRFVSSGVLGPMPPAIGWWTQQVLKLLASRIVGCDRYVVLDAKNHFIRPLYPAFLEGVDGRLLSRRHCYRQHPLRYFLERTLGFCDLPIEPHIGCFMQADTPFTVDRHDAQSAIAFVEATALKPFAEAFLEARITEFFLLASDLTRKGMLEDRYDCSQVACPVIWQELAGPAALLPVIREAEESCAPIFTVHRRTISKLDHVSQGILARFWQRRGLFGSTQQAVAELASYGSSVAHRASRPEANSNRANGHSEVVGGAGNQVLPLSD